MVSLSCLGLLACFSFHSSWPSISPWWSLLSFCLSPFLLAAHTVQHNASSNVMHIRTVPNAQYTVAMLRFFSMLLQPILYFFTSFCSSFFFSSSFNSSLRNRFRCLSPISSHRRLVYNRNINVNPVKKCVSFLCRKCLFLIFFCTRTNVKQNEFI